MPITCPITFPALTTEEFAELDYAVMAHAFASQQALGRLADESVYQADFAARLQAAGWTVQREVPIVVSFRGFVKTYSVDVVVSAKGVYELKTATKLTPEHEAQVMNYLFLLDCRRGKLVNFRPASVEAKFINAPMTAAERRAFAVIHRHWKGDAAAHDSVVELLRDWGTGLELPLYHQAIVHLLGGDAQVTRELPMRRDDIALGNQRFHLMSADAAFRVTAFEEPLPQYEQHLHRLIQFSPLRALHWINIARHQVTFTTIE